MFNLVRAEILKQKRSFMNKMIWIIPSALAILSIFILPYGVFEGMMNWWYMLFLPFIFTYVASSLVRKDEKKNNHGLLALVEDKKKLWYAKVMVAIGYVVLANMILGVIILLSSRIFGFSVPIGKMMIGMATLCITFAPQIVGWMFLAQKMGEGICVLLSVICNLVIAALCAVESYWWIPVAIPARLMCPILGIMPNGLLVEEAGAALADKSVIALGLVISSLLFILVLWLSAKAYEKKEV